MRAVRDGSAAILRKLGLRKDEGLVAQARLAQVRFGDGCGAPVEQDERVAVDSADVGEVDERAAGALEKRAGVGEGLAQR